MDRNIHIGRFVLPEDSTWAGKSLNKLRLRNRFGVHVSSIIRGSHCINIPRGNTIIFPGDAISAIGNDSQLSAISSALKTEIIPEDTNIEQHEMILLRIVLSDNSPFVGKTLVKSGIRDEFNCMVVGMDEGQTHITSINPKQILERGDILWIVGERDNVKRVKELSGNSI